MASWSASRFRLNQRRVGHAAAPLAAIDDQLEVAIRANRELVERVQVVAGDPCTGDLAERLDRMLEAGGLGGGG